jgi:hypothetical protein
MLLACLSGSGDLAVVAGKASCYCRSSEEERAVSSAGARKWTTGIVDGASEIAS